MRNHITTLFVMSLLLVGCKPLVDSTGGVPTGEPSSSMPSEAKSLGMPSDNLLKGAIINGYKHFESDVLRNGETKVLFFHASWCPYCKEKDENLQKWYRDEQIPLNTYKVDFDTSMELRQRYGVAQQDTFVVVDGQGEAVVLLTSPSLADLKRVLYGNMDRAMEETDSVENFGANDTRENEQPEQEVMMKSGGEFTVYNDDVIGNGEPAVLFFHAQWCPYCIANEKRLQDWYGSGDYDVSTYKIDFDTAAGLKQQYGVVQQDTFIRIDGSGNEVTRLSFPSEDELRQLIQ